VVTWIDNDGRATVVGLNKCYGLVGEGMPRMKMGACKNEAATRGGDAKDENGRLQKWSRDSRPRPCSRREHWQRWFWQGQFSLLSLRKTSSLLQNIIKNHPTVENSSMGRESDNWQKNWTLIKLDSKFQSHMASSTLLVNFKGHGSMKKLSVPEDSIENKLNVLPEEKDREFDIELGVLMLNG
jgi:hypothetical protein